MANNHENKRVFFAFEVSCPWPEHLPEGRLLDPSDRHLTLAFLGNIHYPDLEKILPEFPLPDLRVGLTGKFDKCLFLPSKRPNVVAWHIAWFSRDFDLDAYQKFVADWLKRHHFSVRLNPKGFLPHVTIARRPFRYGEWREAFHPLPLIIKKLHLYESVGGLKYKPIWSSRAFEAPFTITEQVDGLHILVRGESVHALMHNCLTALAFSHPRILRRYGEPIHVNDPGDLEKSINAIIHSEKKMSPLPLKGLQTLQKPSDNEKGVWTWKVLMPKSS